GSGAARFSAGPRAGRAGGNRPGGGGRRTWRDYGQSASGTSPPNGEGTSATSRRPPGGGRVHEALRSDGAAAGRAAAASVAGGIGFANRQNKDPHLPKAGRCGAPVLLIFAGEGARATLRLRLGRARSG